MAIEEISGEISVFFFEDESVRYGLPIMPDSLHNPLQYIHEERYYSCIFCGYTEHKKAGNAGSCPKCQKEEWVASHNKRRVT